MNAVFLFNIKAFGTTNAPLMDLVMAGGGVLHREMLTEHNMNGKVVKECLDVHKSCKSLLYFVIYK